MRVLQLHWAFPPTIGGVETHLVLLGKGLVRKQWEVSLLTGTAGDADMVEDYHWEGMRIRRTPLMDLNHLTPESIRAKEDAIRREIHNFVEETRPQIIHAHNMHYFSPLHTKILVEIKERLGIPLILTAHNVWEDETAEEMLQFASAWDGIICVSDYIRRELEKAGYPKDRLRVVYHGIDTERFAPATPEEKKAIRDQYPELEGKKIIFHPARMGKAKGCHVSVRALDLVRRQFPTAVLAMAGSGNIVDWCRHQPKEIKEITDLINELNLQDHVFIKLFSWDEMPQFYKICDVCIYPSINQEPFGLVMLEAMASGKPLVVTHSGGMPEVVKDGYNGFVVGRSDHRELADRIIQILSDSQLADRLVENGLRSVHQNYNWNLMVNNTITAYERFLEASRARREEKRREKLAKKVARKEAVLRPVAAEPGMAKVAINPSMAPAGAPEVRVSEVRAPAEPTGSAGAELRAAGMGGAGAAQEEA